MAEAVRVELHQRDMLQRDSISAQERADSLRYVRAALAAAERIGWVLVPLEPTTAMTGGWAHLPSTPFQGTSRAHAHAEEVWQAMIARRPLKADDGSGNAQ